MGSPFSVRLQIFGRAQVYGDITTGNPGFSEIGAGDNGAGGVANGLWLEEVSGQVMTLPAGYTVDCPSWGVMDNHFQPTVAVELLPAGSDLALSVHPNPAAAEMSVTLALPQAGDARIEVFDVAGRCIRTLANGWLSASPHLVRWDGRADFGGAVPAGIYLMRVEAAHQVLLRKVVRLK